MTPFRGERYSLVYFTLLGHEKASAANRAALRGNAWPTPVLARYWASVLAPPKGLNQSGIRVALGLGEEFPACIMYSGTSLARNSTLLRCALSFCLTPLAMGTLCAICRAAHQECLNPATWHGCCVDASAISPAGRQAFRHWELWKGARAVVHGRWALTNVSLLMSGRWAMWQWRVARGSPFHKRGDAVVCVSHRPVPTSVTMRAQTSAEHTTVAVGLVSTNQPGEIAKAVFGNSSRALFAGVVFVEGDRAFLVVGDETLKVSRLRLTAGSYVSVGVNSRELVVEVSGQVISADAQIDVTAGHWFATAAMRENLTVQPCWSLLR